MDLALAPEEEVLETLAGLAITAGHGNLHFVPRDEFGLTWR